MSKKTLSTFEKMMQDEQFREQFDKEYAEFALAETLRMLMASGKKSVRKLAEEAGLSSTVIQNMRSGQQEDVKLSNFINISHACGYKLVLEKDNQRLYL